MQPRTVIAAVFAGAAGVTVKEIIQMQVQLDIRDLLGRIGRVAEVEAPTEVDAEAKEQIE